MGQEEANFFWRAIIVVNSLSSASFYVLYWRRSTIVIAVMIGDRYFGSDRRSLFRWRSAIVSDRYFGGNWRSLAKSFTRSHWQTVKLQSGHRRKYPLCSRKNQLDLFAANGWPNITRNARWPAFASPNDVFMSCSHYITHSLTLSINLCGQGLTLVKATFLVNNIDRIEAAKHVTRVWNIRQTSCRCIFFAILAVSPAT